jgi:predicted nucleic acid-binding protein
VDASVSFKWYLKEEELADLALQIWDGFENGVISVAAPHISRHEIASSFATACRMARISWESAEREIANYANCGVSRNSDPVWLLQRGARFAVDLKIGFYDAVYIALADRLGVNFLTADRKLVETEAGNLSFVTYLGDL